MTTKKINSTDVQPNLLQNLQAQQKRKKGPGDLLDAIDQQEESAGRVNVGLSSSINSEFNPEKIAAERAEKVKRIKELVGAGKYHRSSEEIAAAVNEEIVFSILADGGSGVLEN